MLIIYIDDLLEEISDIPAFGYADDFKAITQVWARMRDHSRENTEMEQSKPYGPKC